MDAVGGHRSQVHAREFAAPVAADHEQLGVPGFLGQRDGRTVLDHPGDDRDVRVRA